MHMMSARFDSGAALCSDHPGNVTRRSQLHAWQYPAVLGLLDWRSSFHTAGEICS